MVVYDAGKLKLFDGRKGRTTKTNLVDIYFRPFSSFFFNDSFLFYHMYIHTYIEVERLKRISFG